MLLGSTASSVAAWRVAASEIRMKRGFLSNRSTFIVFFSFL